MCYYCWPQTYFDSMGSSIPTFYHVFDMCGFGTYMEWQGFLSKMSYKDTPFDTLMSMRLGCKPPLTDEDRSILDNLVREREVKRVAHGFGSHVGKQVVDCIMPTPLASNHTETQDYFPSYNHHKAEQTNLPLSPIGTPTDTMRLAKGAKAILESKQLSVLVNTHNIHFEEYSNNNKNKGKSSHS